LSFVDNKADSLEHRRLEKWNLELDNYEEGDLVNYIGVKAEETFMLDNLQAKLDDRWLALEGEQIR
jgi:hypothetical protein